ncbi:5-formyltetrahydrofolate cyclo-ligase [Pseudoscardovia radai]|uniref:5-formyltetrahydrofolate cyclo-ligase n=1 Tax=Pseudoscardovia radai TaxID=987066 RepID=A0A261F098_9BIFI|nr:5-formyltetrahydrofolate cyclo-ligase [Pseudoscardovia radai]OZG52518.1 5-formyltetrahydrofolate cyclo-ligase [Pseudoscardovia radai]
MADTIRPSGKHPAPEALGTSGNPHASGNPGASETGDAPEVPGVSELKQDLRREAYGQRRAHITGWRAAIRPSDVLRLESRLRRGSETQGAGTVAAFEPIRREPDMGPLISWFKSRGGRVLVPAMDIAQAPDVESMTVPSGRRLSIGWRLHDDTPPEQRPIVTVSQPLAQADLLFIPALAVDRAGTRLGRGAGWYDRALTHRNPEAWRIAVIWPWELRDAPLPSQAHDVPMDIVLTCKGIVPISDRAKNALD